jgi:adenylate cyclase
MHAIQGGGASIAKLALADRSDEAHRAVVGHMDMAGYGRLTALDGPGTLTRLHTIQDQIIRAVVARHGGRVVRFSADEALVEFESANAAVVASIELQERIEAFNQPLSPDRKLRFRIGLHVGEVVIDRDDLFGTAVNIAARLQALADPGGLVLSFGAFEEIPKELRTQFEDMGAIPLKNIPQPVRAYRWCAHTALEGRPPFRVPLRQPAGRPSIAVLPFTNLTVSDDYFADGLVEDIVVSLASFRELFVISRSSTLAYRGRNLDAPSIARALGVQYVVRGNVRRSAERLRISVELIEAETGSELWSDRAESPLGDLFDIQDRAVQHIISGIAPHIQEAELKRSLRQRPESFTAYDHTLQGLALIYRLDQAGFEKAREFLQKAIDAEPGFAMAHAWAARWHSLRVGQGWSPDPARDRTEALRLAARAIELDHRNALALTTYGHLKSFLSHDYDSDMVYLDRAISACPSSPLAWAMSSVSHSYVGKGAEAVRRVEQALRISPFDQALYFYYSVLCLAHYAGGNWEEAIKWGRVAMNENASFTATARYLTGAFSAAGRLAEAKTMARELLAREPDFTLSRYDASRLHFRDTDRRERHLDHLRQAGLPE